MSVIQKVDRKSASWQSIFTQALLSLTVRSSSRSGEKTYLDGPLSGVLVSFSHSHCNASLVLQQGAAHCAYNLSSLLKLFKNLSNFHRGVFTVVVLTKSSRTQNRMIREPSRD